MCCLGFLVATKWMGVGQVQDDSNTGVQHDEQIDDLIVKQIVLYLEVGCEEGLCRMVLHALNLQHFAPALLQAVICQSSIRQLYPELSIAGRTEWLTFNPHCLWQQHHPPQQGEHLELGGISWWGSGRDFLLLSSVHWSTAWNQGQSCPKSKGTVKVSINPTITGYSLFRSPRSTSTASTFGMPLWIQVTKR